MDKFLDLPPVKIHRPKVSYNCNLNSSYDSHDGSLTDIMDTGLVWVNMKIASRDKNVNFLVESRSAHIILLYFVLLYYFKEHIMEISK